MKKLLFLAIILFGAAAIVIYLMPEEYRENPELLAEAINAWMAENMPEG